MSGFFIIASLVSLLVASLLAWRICALWQRDPAITLSGARKGSIFIVIILASLTFVLSRLAIDWSDYWLPLIGSWLFSLLLCGLYMILLFDLCFFLYRLGSGRRWQAGFKTRLFYLVAALALFAFAVASVQFPRTVIYQVDIDKPAKVEHLRIVLLSDIHITAVTPVSQIQKLVDETNQLEPDLIVIAGDTLDQRLAPFIDKQLAPIFAQLKAPYGRYILFGNHEYLGMLRDSHNSADEIIQAFSAAKLHVIKDQALYLDKLGLTLIGRDDYSKSMWQEERMPLSQLMVGRDRNQPIIVLDHQPRFLDELAAQGVDLMLSGHTHAGQIAPMNFIISALYQNAWGVKQIKLPEHTFTSVVSSGYGFWGLPIRLLTRSEIVAVDLHFRTP